MILIPITQATATGNTITIIDYGGASYAYGIEAMSYDDPNFNLQRPPLAPNPLSLGVAVKLRTSQPAL